ncbi:MFS transporter [Brucellaceae bacterium C25G]
MNILNNTRFCSSKKKTDLNREHLPLSALLALAMAAFITIITEALPAGLLPQMSTSLSVSEAMIGQLVTIYAIGSLVAAIPLTTATQKFRRRPLLLLAVGGFAVVNTITAISESFLVIMIARFFAGVFAGLLWAMAAGYAARMVPEQLQGKAIAVAMAGAPVALSLGIPAGTLLGHMVGWRITFGIMSGLTIVLVFWVLAKVPDFAGQISGKKLSLKNVFFISGIRPILLVTFLYVLAHNILYTYIAPFLVLSDLQEQIDIVLMVFGVAALVSIWIVGALIDRWLHQLMLVSIALFGLSAICLAIGGNSPLFAYISIAVWGLAFGGAATLLQTASAKKAKDATDIAQSMIVTVWNVAIAGGGIIGGILLGQFGVMSFPWVLIVLLLMTFVVAFGWIKAKQT